MDESPVVVVTRTVPGDASLARRLERDGHSVLRCPMFELEPVEASALVDAYEQHAPFDRLVVTSPRAAEVALRVLGRERLARSVVVVPGPGTASALAAAGLTAVHPVTGGTSEDVLALPELAAANVAGERVGIVAAPGGRTLIGQTLVQRGAEVRRLVPFQRRALAPAPALLDALGNGRPTITLLSSPAALTQLSQALSEPLRAAWLSGGFIASSPRLAELAAGLGAADVSIAEGASDDALRAALVERLAR